MDGDEDSVAAMSFDTSSIDLEEQRFHTDWSRIADNDPHTTQFAFDNMGGGDFILTVTNEEWEQFGRDISNNTHLQLIDFESIFSDNENALESFLRGLVGSTSIVDVCLDYNRISPAGLRSLVLFLQNSSKLTSLTINQSNIGSEGFNILLRGLRDTSIENLVCSRSGIGSFEIECGYFPRMLKMLSLSRNNISIDGCKEIAKLLQWGDATLEYLNLSHSKIGDNSAAILVDALRTNTSLKKLYLEGNNGISKEGKILFLKLLNDISSIKSTRQSNHALKIFHLYRLPVERDVEILSHINEATQINMRNENNPGAAWREKMIRTQLDSKKRTRLSQLQGVSPSLYSEIDANLLPEVLALVSSHHGWGELFVSLKSSIADVISIVNEKMVIKQRLACLAAEMEKLRAKLEEIESAEDERAQEFKRTQED